MKLKKTLMLLSLISSFYCQGQYDKEALSILEAMSSKYKKIPSFIATFTQKLTNEEVKIEESIEGKIAVKENKYVLTLAEQKIFNNGIDLYAYNEEAKEVTISPIEEEAINFSNIFNLYQNGFKYVLLSVQANGDRVIDLAPENRNESYFKIRLIIKANNSLRSFSIYDKTKNKYEYLIASFKKSDLSDVFFVFDKEKYPNVEIIDFR